MFVTLVATRVVAQVVMGRVSPKFLNIITGGRSDVQGPEKEEGIRVRC